MRKTSRTVFSSSWSRVRQAKELDEWQIMAHVKIAASYAPPRLNDTMAEW